MTCSCCNKNIRKPKTILGLPVCSTCFKQIDKANNESRAIDSNRLNYIICPSCNKITTNNRYSNSNSCVHCKTTIKHCGKCSQPMTSEKYYETSRCDSCLSLEEICCRCGDSTESPTYIDNKPYCYQCTVDNYSMDYYENDSDDEYDDYDEDDEDTWNTCSTYYKRVLGKTYNKITSKRTFGIELEAEAVVKPPKDLYETKWIIKSDGSIRGREFNSPILRGDDGLKEIQDFLSTTRCVAGHDTGFHLHIGTQDYTVASLVRLIKFHLHIEDFMFELVHPTRFKNDYCNPIGKSKLSVFAKEKNTPKLMAMIAKFNSYESYTPDIKSIIYKIKKIGVNVARYSFNYSGVFYKNRETVEIRLHHGTFNYQEIEDWIRLNVMIVDLCRNTSELKLIEIKDKIKTRLDFIMFIKERLDNDIALRYIQRVDKYWGVLNKEVYYGRGTETRTEQPSLFIGQ